MCGSKQVKHRAIALKFRNGRVVAVDADVCLNCGKQYFDPEEVEAIDQATNRTC